MPASSSRDEHQADDAVRAAVIRLSRSDGDGGAVIERAAILAEGRLAPAIEEWILAHGGEPEAQTIGARAPGLYGPRPDRTAVASARPPRRYVFPARALV
jgi:hypothetical protein